MEGKAGAVEFLERLHQRAKALVGDAVIDAIRLFAAGDMSLLLQDA